MWSLCWSLQCKPAWETRQLFHPPSNPAQQLSGIIRLPICSTAWVTNHRMLYPGNNPISDRNSLCYTRQPRWCTEAEMETVLSNVVKERKRLKGSTAGNTNWKDADVPMSATDHLLTMGELGIVWLCQKTKNSLIYQDLLDTNLCLTQKRNKKWKKW